MSARAIFGATLFWMVTCGRQPPLSWALEQAVKAVGELVADAIEIGETIAQRDAAAEVHQPAIDAVGGGCAREFGEAARAARASADGGKRVEHREMRGELVALGRIMRAAQALRARRNPRRRTRR